MVLDITLISLFHTPQVYALGLSVILAGFVYFPLRQWILVKLLPLEDHSLHDFLPTFSALMADAITVDEFERQWQCVLRKRFQPLRLEHQNKQLDSLRLEERGLTLQVPALDKQSCYRLTGKRMATRRFRKADIQAASALLDIARIVSSVSDLREQVVLKERRRVMHDLHDTVGAHLLSLSHTVETPMHRKAVKNTLQTLRDMIHLNLQTRPCTLEEHLADWRAEIIEQAEMANVQLEWLVDDALYDTTLTSTSVIHLGLFIKETASEFFCDADLRQLHITIKNDRECISAAVYMNNLPMEGRDFSIYKAYNVVVSEA